MGKIALLLIVGLVLIVALSAVAYLILADIRGPSVEDERATLVMGSPKVNQRAVGGAPHWDVNSTVAAVTPRGVEVPWSELRVIVISSSGAVLVGASAVRPDGPLAYDDASDGTVEVEGWYLDVYGDGHADTGDILRLTGMTADYEGATVRLTRGGELVAAFVLPSAFA